MLSYLGWALDRIIFFGGGGGVWGSEGVPTQEIARNPRFR